MVEPVLARLTRRRFLAFLGLAAAGGAATALAATELAKTPGPAQPAASGGPLTALAGSPPPGSPPPSAAPSPDYSAFRSHYRSRPDLTPPQVLVQVPAGAVAPGLLFYTPSDG